MAARTCLKVAIHKLLRKAIAFLPRKQRFSLFRSFADCNPAPSSRLVLKIADTQEELEACFKVLHDAYVDAGFMKPDPSGMRVTIYHALPTTTTLCAKYDGVVVGTISLVRESALGVPMQKIFDLASVRLKSGNLAEVSALAVARNFRNKGGIVLFPLMKFMYEYCTSCFDTRHLVIAVNPRHIELYESLLFFKRLDRRIVEKYDFVNGAPAVGATLDLFEAPKLFKKHYAGKPLRRNLYTYFTKLKLSNIHLPKRRFFTTNDPVLTPELVDYFFNIKTNVFKDLPLRDVRLLHSIYDLTSYQAVLPALPFDDEVSVELVRKHPRFSVKCPGVLMQPAGGENLEINIVIFDVSQGGFQAWVERALPLKSMFNAIVRLGVNDVAHIQAVPTRAVGRSGEVTEYYGFSVSTPDSVWEKFVAALARSATYSDLHDATRFI